MTRFGYLFALMLVLLTMSPAAMAMPSFIKRWTKTPHQLPPGSKFGKMPIKAICYMPYQRSATNKSPLQPTKAVLESDKANLGASTEDCLYWKQRIELFAKAVYSPYMRTEAMMTEKAYLEKLIKEGC